MADRKNPLSSPQSDDPSGSGPEDLEVRLNIPVNRKTTSTPTGPATVIPERQSRATPARPSSNDLQQMRQNRGGPDKGGRRSLGPQRPDRRPNYRSPKTAATGSQPQASGSQAPGRLSPSAQGQINGSEAEPQDLYNPDQEQGFDADSPGVKVERDEPTYDSPGNEPPNPAAQSTPWDTGNKTDSGIHLPTERRTRTPEGTKDTASDLDEKENSAASSGNNSKPNTSAVPKNERSLWNPSSKSDKPGRFNVKNLFATRRRAILGGGGIIGTLIGIIFGFSVLQGPFQFLHFSQLLQQFHLLSQEDAGDDRMGRLYRFIRSGGDVGETRVGYLGSKMKTKMLSQLSDIGIKPDYGSFKTFQGFTIDTQNPNSPYYNKSQDTIKERLKSKGITTGITIQGNEVHVEAKSYWSQRRAHRAMVEDLGKSKIGTAVRVRVLAKYGLVTWHPMKILDKKFNQKLAVAYDKWRADREERLKRGVQLGEIDPSQAKEDNKRTDKNGRPIYDDVAEPKTQLPPSKTQDILGKISASKSLRIAGGVAGAIGVVCVVNNVAVNIGDIRKEQVTDPLTRMGMDAVTTGEQVKTGQDFDTDGLGFLAKNFNGKNSKNKDEKETSAFDARSIQAEQGQNQTGPDVDEAIKENIAGELAPWLSWSLDPTVGVLCSEAGSIITGIVSFAVGIFSGGTVNAISGAAIGAIAAPLAIDKLSDFLAGQSVNVMAAGAEFGNYANYGVRLAGNSMALGFGGVELAADEISQLKAQERALAQEQFESKSIGYKLFDPYDSSSAISKLIDHSKPVSSQSLANISGLLSSSLKTAFASLGSLFNVHVAAADEAYDYGFPKIGFSQQDLDNPLVEDPYANADEVAKLLNSAPNAEDYIKKANKCFGVDIVKIANDDSTPRWDVIPSDKPANPYDPNPSKFPKDCADKTDSSWLRLRFFIFDTGQMEGYACFEDDEQSCVNNGISQASEPSSSTTTAPNSGVVVGDVGNNSDSVACAAGTKDLGVAASQYTGSFKNESGNLKIRLCQLSSIPGEGNNTSGAEIGGGGIVNSRVSGAFQALGEAAKAAGIKLSSSSSFRLANSCGGTGDGSSCATPGNSPHQLGVAIDFAEFDFNKRGTSTTSCSGRSEEPSNPTWNWLLKNADSFGLEQYSYEAWHWDPLSMENRCKSSERAG